MTEPNTPSTLSIKYVPALDGLRGVAILLVITYHYFGSYSSFFSLGWAGVDLFFVLSGFLITKRLIDNKDKKNRYAIFYINRVLRIFPLYYAVLILFYAAIFFLVSHDNFHRFDWYLKNWPYFFLFLENWVFLRYVPIEKHLCHFWSLAVEEQFYLLWPWALYKFYSSPYLKRSLWIVVTIICFARLIVYYFNIHEGNDGGLYYYSNTIWRMDSFIIGALTYFLLQKQQNKLLAGWLFFASLLILIAGVILANDISTDSRFFGTIGFTALALLFMSVIYFIITAPNSFFSRFFKLSFLVKTGKISYGLYIFHWLVLITVGPKLSALLKNTFPESSSLVSAFICLLISYLLSFLSYNYYESYFLKQKK